MQAQTAKELLDTGYLAFSNLDYPKAEDQLARFVQDYGKSAEAGQSMEPALRLLGVARLKQEKFEPALETMIRYLKDYPQGSKAEDFAFWVGLAQMKSGDPDKADGSFAKFIEQYPRSKKIQDAQFSRGLCLLQQDKFKEVAAYYPPLLPQLKPEQAYQARVIRLYALMESGKLDEAVTALGEIDLQSEAAAKIAATHLLALDLGNKLLEKEDYRQALAVLQKVWSKNRILARQKGRLEKMKTEIARLGTGRSPDESYELVNLKDIARQVEGEVAQLEKMADYDTALQFRIGQCFFQLDRPRETYLSMKQMLEKLPDSDLLASADYTMLVCLTRMERWDEAIAASLEFDKRFPKSKELPNVLYLKAESYQRIYNYAEAHLAFMDAAKRFPAHAQAPRCLFLAGYALLMQDKNKEAYDHFENLLKDNPKSPFAEQALYWQCMSLHFAKDYVKSREAFAGYLKDYPKGTYQADAVFRRAQSLFNQKLFTDAYKELELFLKKYPDAVVHDEACNLLGDCYLALGEVERGMEAYGKISGKDKKLADYAVFRIGQVYKAEEDYPAMQKHFQKFIKERPDSPRLTEGLAQLAWIYRRLEQPDKARDLYWEALKKYGNDPDAPAVEDMLKSLARMYRQPEEKTAFQVKLADLSEEAVAGKQPTLAARSAWMRAVLLDKTEPDKASSLRLGVPALAQPKELSAVLLADVGDELRRAKRWDEAANYYQTILSWYPTSMLRDRAYAGLGMVAQQQGKNKEALELFARFEKENSQSPLLAEVLQNRAGLYLERSQYDEAATELERILQVPAAKGKPWVEALYRIGEIKLKQKDPKRAIPYFQRIYVMYGKWPDYVAKAYWQSGQAFEQLDMKTEAVNTYKEFIGQEQLQTTPEYSKAQARLKEVGGA